MDDIRFALTVLPVGPRGQHVLESIETEKRQESSRKLWFALQLTAGLKNKPKDPGAWIDYLWPWAFHKVNGNNQIELSAWLIESDNKFSPIQASCLYVPEAPHDAEFAVKLMQEIQKIYSSENIPQDLDLRLLFPSELENPSWDKANNELENYLTNNFPARVSYLATLPGELARRLLANIYVAIDIECLFEKKDEQWRPKKKRLWIAPRYLVIKDNTLEHETGNYPIYDETKKLYMLQYANQSTGSTISIETARAYGPGFKLNNFADIPESALFNSSTLKTFWLPIHEGDSRFKNVEEFLLNVLNPFAEINQLNHDWIRENLVIRKSAPKSAQQRHLSEEELAVVMDIWKVQTLANVLDADMEYVKMAVGALTIRLVDAYDFSENLIKKMVNLIKDNLTEEWLPKFRGLAVLEILEKVANVLKVHDHQTRGRLRSVATRSNFSTLNWWIIQAFTTALEIVGESDLESDLANLFEEIDNKWSFTSEGVYDFQQITDRRTSLINIVIEEIREEKELSAIFNALVKSSKRDDSVEKLRSASKEWIKARWNERLNSSVTEALSKLGFPVIEKDVTLVLDGDAATEKYLKKTWDSQKMKFENAGEPIKLLVGNPEYRFIHQNTEDRKLMGKSNEDDITDVFSEMTGHLLLVRRHNSEKTLSSQHWRLVSGGVAVIGRLETLFTPTAIGEDEGKWLPELLGIAEENVFQNSVLRMDKSYDGKLKHIQSPLEFAYAAQGITKLHESPLSSAFSYQGLGAFKTQTAKDDETQAVTKALMHDAAIVASAPPLRYGDTYQFAVALVDSAGGLPSEIADDEYPWKLDVEKFLADPPNVVPEDDGNVLIIKYVRKQPVGEINILPGKEPWPTIDKSVSLRSKEWWNSIKEKDNERRDFSDNVPEILLYHGEGFSGTYTVELQPPSIDEFTLERWVTPPVGESKNAAIKEKLITALTNILEARKNTNEKSNFIPELMVHDPAVSAFSLRIRIFDQDGNQCPEIIRTIVLRDDPETFPDKEDLKFPFRRIPFKLKFQATEWDGKDAKCGSLALDNDEMIQLNLPAGSFACIQLWPLVKRAEFENRFADEVIFQTVIDDIFPRYDKTTEYIAFKPSVLLCEVATDKLPSSEQLYDGFSIADSGGTVRVDFKAERIKNLQFVDSFSIKRERWVWRNRPVLVVDQVGGDLAAGNDIERRRLGTSGLPGDAFPNPGETSKIDTSTAIKGWEEVAALDRGFIDRGNYVDRWPRKTPQNESHSGGTMNNTTLHIDDRDGTTAADYLRYGLTVRSRYAAIIKTNKEITAKKPINQDRTVEIYKRIVIPFQGQLIKPPKILNVIPLTRSLDADPLSAANIDKSTNPFLVLLDETWFREYGIGERLEARLTLEASDLGDPKEEAKVYRVGPLPDHYKKRNNYFREKLPHVGDGGNNSEVLDAFGPFGYTLDVSPDEALANASAFVIYPPADVGPHWGMFVHFVRVLDLPDLNPPRIGVNVSEPSDTYALYTLPDEKSLIKEAGDSAHLLLRSTASAMDYIGELCDMSWLVDPLAGAEQITGAESVAANNYRYFILVSKIITAAGHNEKVEMPVGVLRIDPDVKRSIIDKGLQFKIHKLKGSPEKLESSNQFVGRIMEVLLNGKYDNLSPLDRKEGKKNCNEIGIRDFWNSLLSIKNLDSESTDRNDYKNSIKDADGMIRRISPSFMVKEK